MTDVRFRLPSLPGYQTDMAPIALATSRKSSTCFTDDACLNINLDIQSMMHCVDVCYLALMVHTTASHLLQACAAPKLFTKVK